MRIKRRHKREAADLDVTSFMNLMIILVPVLLISMVFARTMVLDLKRLDLADSSVPQEVEPQQRLELVIRKDYLDVKYPAGVCLNRVDNTAEGEHDYILLTLFLQ